MHFFRKKSTGDPRLRSIKNEEARRLVEQALDYKRRIDDAVSRQPEALRAQLKTTSGEIDKWIDLFFRLAQNIDMFDTNRIIRLDREAVPRELENLKTRLVIESNAEKRAKLQADIDIRQKLLDNLQKIVESYRQTHAKLAEGLDMLKKVWEQIQALDQHQE